MWVPIHVLRTCIGLRMPSARTFGQGDGFNQVIALVHRLAVRNGRQSIEQGNAEPPAIGVGGVRVERLGEPVGCNVEQQAMGHIVHPTAQPFLMNFKGVVAEVHAMRDNQVHHGVEMAVKHAAVYAENAKTFLEETVRGRRGDGWKVGVAHWRLG